ncbi:MAG: hypothetical protein HY774_07585 [Acidobacteria bacterium]|nr:hypothetical protein [Acidobacteriota bacterium]
MVCRFGHTTGASVRSGLRPDGRWKLVRVPVFVEFSAAGSRLLFQRPSGREPVMAALSGGRVSKATLATGYCPAPIRAKTNISPSEWLNCIPLLWGLVLRDCKKSTSRFRLGNGYLD